MFAVLTCIFVQHDLRLVAVAAGICSVACCSAFAFHTRGLKASGAMRWAWLGLSALDAGAGVWSTHFVAMLAYQPTLKIGYDLTGTALSLLAAVVGMGVAFSLPAWRPGRTRDRSIALIAGAAAGASIAVMHYTGIAAIRTQADVSWSMAYVAASILIAAAGGMGAFAVRNVLTGRWPWAPPAGVFLLGIVGLHFTAMTAVTLTPDPALVTVGAVMDRGGLALATGGLAMLVLAAGAGLMLMERLGQRNTFANVRHALNAVPAGLAFFDPSDRVQVWNGAYAALMAGCGIEVVAGASRRAHIEAAEAAGWFPDAADDEAGWVDVLAERRLGAAAEFHLPDGRWLRHESFRTADGGGVAVLTDVTDQKHSAAVMAAARDAAEAANRAKSEFLANISHEIRTPLNGVLGVAEVLTRTGLSAKQSQLVGVIQQSGALLNGLLTDLLDLARVEAGVVELRPESVQLADLVGSVKDLFAGAAEEKDLALSVGIDPAALGLVECDPQRLRQVLGNLLNNAIKFTEAGQVTLSAQRRGDRVRFEVRDTGAGFDADQKATIFQRFRQADNTATRKHGGAGLGLAICNDFVRLMGGELGCDSAPGQGSVFSFTLDLPWLEACAEPAAEAAPDAPDVAPSDDFMVLIVDDNPVNRQVMELILESVGIGHVSAKDGREGVEAMKTGAFDAVLMDIQMPVMDGFEATRRIRDWERSTHRPRAPILMVSANCLPQHVADGREAGADAHINKPISASELVSALEAQMHAAHVEREKIA
ncbi:ATP-binding protein [Phenylobacterium sp.]|uniref:ATP-binding protein n=1 Tax=Phenylobacterium sp. TaxID=1871053 RepID=UPI00122BEFE0|nr:ATP-binding protein [Phenylobacterium sp.]THD56120.1 MAG: response regulator [Phenylobacterium sp.]